MTNLVTIPDLSKDIDREFARRAFYNTSFSPERRGDQMISDYQQEVKNLADLVEKLATDDKHKEIAQEVFDYYKDGLLKKYTAWISAKSNCLSSMITGPANFPVRKAEKANQAEHKRCVELCDYSKNLPKFIKKKFAGVYTAQEKQLSELEQMKMKLEKAEKHQQFMKDANKAYRAFKKNPESEATKKLFAAFTEKEQETIKNWTPDYSFEKAPFATYQMQNNLANIKRMQGRVSELEKKAELAENEGSKDIEFNGLTVVMNYEQDRIQMLFDEKPDADTRSVLKSNAFKWSPKNEAWQRKITNNAIYATKNYVLKSEAFSKYK